MKNGWSNLTFAIMLLSKANYIYIYTLEYSSAFTQLTIAIHQPYIHFHTPITPIWSHVIQTNPTPNMFVSMHPKLLSTKKVQDIFDHLEEESFVNAMLVWSIVSNGVGAIQVQNSLFTMSFFGWPIEKKKKGWRRILC